MQMLDGKQSNQGGDKPSQGHQAGTEYNPTDAPIDQDIFNDDIPF